MSTSKYQTIIDVNGIKFSGLTVDSLDVLYERLKAETLDPVLEKHGDFWFWIPSQEKKPTMLRFYGNFYSSAYAFSIDTNDPKVIERLTTLIIDNKCTPAYQEAKKKLRAKDDREEKELIAWRKRGNHVRSN